MNRTIALALLSAAALSAPACAKETPPPKGHFGSEWYKKPYSYRPSMGVNIADPQTLDPATYREVAFDWRKSKTNTGPYPAAAFAKLQEGDVGVELAISAAGAPTACGVTKSSGVPSIDAHVCPHLMAKARFTPRMDKSGALVAVTLPARISYELTLKFIQAAGSQSSMEPPPRAKPLAEITGATMGLAAFEPRGGGYEKYISYRLAVDVNGVPTACLIRGTSGSNARDKTVCDNLLANARFKPAMGKAGTAIASEYWGGSYWAEPPSR